MTLEEACKDMLNELRDEYDMGPGDAKDLFEAIWHTMVRDSKGQQLNKSINDVEDEFSIGQ